MTPELIRLILKVKKIGPDMTKPVYPGGYQPPAAGLARARLVAYLEMGLHEEEFEGKKRDREKVDLIFELSGPNHEPRKLDDGTLIPIRITVQETLSLDPGSNFFSLFAAMNHKGNATHMIELLGMPYLAEVFHIRSKDYAKVFATLKRPFSIYSTAPSYNITAPEYKDLKTGKIAAVEVEPALTELKAFVWKLASKAMWDSIYIPGEYAEQKDETGKVIYPARSKNVIQEKMKAAKNWPPPGLASLSL